MTTSAPTAVRTRGPRRRTPRQFGQRAAFLGPALGLLALLVVVPLIYTITLAVQDMPASLRGGTFVGLDNFAALAEDGRFWAATARTFIYSISAVVIETVLGVLVALALHQEFRSRAMLRSLVLLPMIATPVAIAMVWRLMFQPQLGVLNTILEALGLSPLDWVADPALALPSLILVDIWEWTPLITLITLAGLAGLPSEPLEAAMVDGTNAWQRFWHVTLPMLRPVIGVAVLLRFIEAMRTFDPIFVITGGGPREATETLNLYVYQLAFQYLRPSYAAAAVIVFVIFMVLCSLAVVRLSKGEKR